MGDLTWLANIGPSGLLAIGIFLMFLGALVPRWVIKREQEISDQWRHIAEVSQATTAEQTELLKRIIFALERQGLPLALDPPDFQRGPELWDGINDRSHG